MSQNYSHLKIRLASPEEIKSWSYGEVLNHETINYRTLKPERGGLFAEEIFGPVKDFQCACSSKSKKNTNIENKKCPVCGVEITESKVRRERMGHITLAAPVVHTWYLKSTPSKLALLLDLKASDLEEVVYLASYIVIEPGDNTDLEFKQILTEFEFKNAWEKWENKFSAKTGGEAILALLKKINLESEVTELRRELKASSKQKRERVVKRLAVVESFKNSDNNPEWMVLTTLPVIPPDLRPMVQLDGGRFATTGLNDLYRRILNRNNRLKKLNESNAPHLITKNEKRLLQEAVDALIDNSKRGKKAAVTERNHPLKSLSDQLRGKQGRFRQNLLGKRVDYSGRSVIVVGPNLQMHQCGVPREMALILFKPFVIHELMAQGISTNVKGAKRLIDNKDDKVWGPLDSVVLEHPVLLNRAPTLHRLGIQAFEPILIDGKAIQLHPLACPAFNADFDGDQMPIHVPLSEEAQAEARVMMLASNNILNPKDGKPVAVPSQDMVLGNYYLTMEVKGDVGEGRVFKDIDEAEIAYTHHQITLHSRIIFKASSLPFKMPEEHTNDYIVTTYGKVIFNGIMVKGFPYLNEPSNENLTNKTPDKFFFKPGTNIKEFINALDETRVSESNRSGVTDPFKKGFLGKIIAKTFAKYKTNETSKMLDRLKDLGFHYSTVSGITVSAFDIEVYQPKYEIVKEAQELARKYNEYYEMGEITNEERYRLITTKVWPNANKRIANELIKNLRSNHSTNHLYMMLDSGARGNPSNFTQLAGVRGLMNDTKGRAIEIPVTNCFREGLSMREFFVSTHGSRKGSTDTALKTADSGYLTRRLVDVSQDVAIREYDCGTDRGIMIEEIVNKEDKTHPIETLYSRILGRFAYKDCIDPNTGEVLVKKNEYITEDIADSIINAGIKSVGIRTVCTCNSKNGICVKCYGRNLATNGIVEVGEAVGIIASQSIGEPGTQLTMRTFHTGGVAGGDITSGLPRVQELFEARTPKGEALIAEFTGKVSLGTNQITVDGALESRTYNHKPGATVLVQNGQNVTAGTELTEGSINLRQLLKSTNIETVQQYIIREIQKVYSKEGVGINDKHIEIIVRQMTKRLVVQLEGDTKLLPGSLISSNHYAEANEEALLSGHKPAVATPIILGITKAALRSDSFLSAASFQETTKVLTDAAIAGATDYLRGLKENVIIGGLIPAGTGILQTTKFEYEGKRKEEEETYDSFNN